MEVVEGKYMDFIERLLSNTFGYSKAFTLSNCLHSSVAGGGEDSNSPPSLDESSQIDKLNAFEYSNEKAYPTIELHESIRGEKSNSYTPG